MYSDQSVYLLALNRPGDIYSSHLCLQHLAQGLKYTGQFPTIIKLQNKHMDK